MSTNEPDCHELENRILSYKRFDPFMPHARLLLEFWKKKCWRVLGHEQVMDWLKRYPENYTQAYTLVKIAERLGPHLSDEELEQIGISKCYEFARIMQPGSRPDPEIVKKAKELPFRDFERYIEAILLKKGSPQIFGEIFNPRFRGLQHAPLNELGVVYLFGVVSDELGFVVESMQPSFPDCLAKEKIQGQPERWRKARIEFEYKSSNFNHPAEGADVVVCWEHDWPDCPVERVIELRKEIKKLPPMVKKIADAGN